MARFLIGVLVSLFIAGCGGGGNSDTSTSEVSEGSANASTSSEQVSILSSISTSSSTSSRSDGSTSSSALSSSSGSSADSEVFGVDVSLLDEHQKRVVGESYNLQALLPFSADVFTTSDESIATVDSLGQVSVHKSGIVEITAENTADADFANMNVFAKETEFYFKSWVGETDSLLEFNTSLLGLSVVRSVEEGCEPILLVDCGAYESDILSASTVTDGITTLNNPAFYNFTFGENTAATSMLSAEKFEVRSGEATIVFNNHLFLIGGYTTGDVNNPREYKNDIWVSKDGDEWLEINESAAFSPRAGHQLIVHDNKLWLFGGSNGNIIHNDVWVSEDGEQWIELAQTNSYSIRTYFELFTLNGEFFVAGGYTTSGAELNDMWRSTDGVNWSQVPNFSLAEASNSPFIIQGEPGEQTALLLADKTYSSTDGLTWTEIDAAPVFTGLSNREATLFNGKIWLFAYTFEYFGARGSKNISRVYKSDDGVKWRMVNGGIYLGNLVAREAKPTVFKDRLFIVGGRAEILEYTNEVWSTTDGNLWVEHTLGGFYGPRKSHAMVSHDGMLYSTGGIASDNNSTSDPYKADVWRSADGLNWQIVEDEHPTFRARGGHTLLSVGDKLCYIGGYGRSAYGTASGYRDPYTVQNPDPAGSVLHVILFRIYGVFGDIACSTDGGVVWSEVVPSTDAYFDAREGFASVYFNDKLWIIGGNLNANYYGDVWTSDLTENWDARLDMFTYGAYFTEFTELASEAPFGPRSGHALTVHNNELYLSAGKNSDGFYLDDLWKTTDGVSWTLVNSDMGDMDKRAFHQMVSFDGKLWILAGRANYHETLVDERTSVYEANDIWVSEDNGITWSEVAEHASFEQRQDFQATVHSGQLYITGGTGGDGYVTVQGKDSILNDVWRTEDGINWRAGFYKELDLSR